MTRDDETRKHEMLGSVYLRGELHAQYPTALRTLCMIESAPRGELMKLRPTCPVCAHTSRRRAFIFDTPKNWYPRRREMITRE